MDNNYNNLNNLNNLNNPSNNNNINNNNINKPDPFNDENDIVNNKKNTKKINMYIVVFATIFFGLLLLIGYLTYVRLVESTKSKNENKVVETKKEFSLASPALKADIMYKTQSILGVKYEKNNTSFNDSAYDFNYEFFTITNLSDKDKKLIALNTAKREYAKPITIEKDKISINSVLEYYDEIENDDTTDTYFQLDEDKVASIYKEFFNGDINNSDVSSCPMYFYDKNNRVYYGIHICGGTSMDRYATYFDSVYANEDEAYIDVYLGLIDCAPNGSKCYYILYDGINKNTVIKENVSTDYLIDSSNKDKFDKYRLMFKKDEEGNYYFDRIEK